jgi:cystathionine gamma-synthase
VPIVLASNFRAGNRGQTGGREYSRDDATPGWEALEEVVGELEGGEAVAFGSGMGAAAAVLDLLPAGARVVAPTDCYAGVHALLADSQQHGRWHVDLVDVTDTAAAAAAAGRADLVWLESPTNPLLDIADLPPLCTAARAGGALVAVDNTFATPLLQQPIALGAHIAVHSATKFLGGHSDLLLGVVVAASPSWASDCAAAGRSPTPSPARWRPSSSCAACAPWPCGWTKASAPPPTWPAASPITPPSPGYATPACPITLATPGQPRR